GRESSRTLQQTRARRVIPISQGGPGCLARVDRKGHRTDGRSLAQTAGYPQVETNSLVLTPVAVPFSPLAQGNVDRLLSRVCKDPGSSKEGLLMVYRVCRWTSLRLTLRTILLLAVCLAGIPQLLAQPGAPPGAASPNPTVTPSIPGPGGA